MDNITLKTLSQSTLALVFAAGISTAAIAADSDLSGQAQPVDSHHQAM